MEKVKKGGTVTLQELLVTSLAQTDAVKMGAVFLVPLSG